MDWRFPFQTCKPRIPVSLGEIDYYMPIIPCFLVTFENIESSSYLMRAWVSETGIHISGNLQLFIGYKRYIHIFPPHIGGTVCRRHCSSTKSPQPPVLVNCLEIYLSELEEQRLQVPERVQTYSLRLHSLSRLVDSVFFFFFGESFQWAKKNIWEFS